MHAALYPGRWSSSRETIASLQLYRWHQALRAKQREVPGVLSLDVPEIHLGSPKINTNAQVPPGQIESLFDGETWASIVLKATSNPPPLAHTHPGDSNGLPGRSTVKLYVLFQNGHNKGIWETAQEKCYSLNLCLPTKAWHSR